MTEMAAPEDQVSCVPTSEIDQLRRDSAVLKLLIEYVLEWGKDYPNDEILTCEKFFTILDHPVMDIVRKKNRLLENAKGAAFFLASIVSTGCGVCEHSHDDHGHNEDSESSENSEESEHSSTSSDNSDDDDDDDDNDWSDFDSWTSEEADSDYVTDADSHSNDEGGDVNDSAPVVDESEEVVPAAPANNFQSDSSDGGLAMDELEEGANWSDVVWAAESSWEYLDTSTSESSSDESGEEEREGSESEGLGDRVAELEKEIALGFMVLGDGQDSSGFSDSVSDEQEDEEDDSNASDESSDHTDSDGSEDGEDGNSDSNEESNDETGSSGDSSDDDYEPPQPNAHKHVIPTLFFCEDHGSWYRLLPEEEKRKCLSVVHPDVMVAELRNFFSQADVGPTKKKFIKDLMEDYLF